jgi:hypothetical protein
MRCCTTAATPAVSEHAVPAACRTVGAAARAAASTTAPPPRRAAACQHRGCTGAVLLDALLSWSVTLCSRCVAWAATWRLSQVCVCAWMHGCGWKPVHCRSHATRTPVQQQPPKVPGDPVQAPVLEGGVSCEPRWLGRLCLSRRQQHIRLVQAPDTPPLPAAAGSRPPPPSPPANRYGSDSPHKLCHLQVLTDCHC